VAENWVVNVEYSGLERWLCQLLDHPKLNQSRCRAAEIAGWEITPSFTWGKSQLPVSDIIKKTVNTLQND